MGWTQLALTGTEDVPAEAPTTCSATVRDVDEAVRRIARASCLPPVIVARLSLPRVTDGDVEVIVREVHKIRG